MEKENIKNAKKLLKVYPSMKELMRYPNLSSVLPPFIIKAYRDCQEWELMSLAVNNICKRSMGMPFDNGYFFPGNSEKGVVNVLRCNGDPIKIESLTVYKALLVIMLCSWMDIPLTNKQVNALELFASNLTIFKIID